MEEERKVKTVSGPQRTGLFGRLLWVLAALAVLGLPALFCGGMLFLAAWGQQAAERLEVIEGSGRADKVLVIPVRGVIGLSGLLPGESGVSAERIIEDLDYADEDPHVRAVLLDVDSPGGGVHATDMVNDRLKRLKKPYFAYFRSVAASGGYYVSCASRRIYADRTCVTGSISVKVESLNVAGLMRMLGMKVEVIKSGKMKDILSPYRPMTDEEREVIQKVVDTFYRYFVDDVAAGRKMDRAEVEKIADGRVFTAEEALSLGLVDVVTSGPAAVYADIRKELGEQVDFVRRRRTDLLDMLLNLSSDRRPDAVRELLGLEGRPLFLYLWGR